MLHFEGKFWRTLPLLAWCPGDLTRRYIAGERARFISPVALYLFCVFLMFAVLNLTGALIPEHPAASSRKSAQAATKQQAQIAEIEKQRAKAIADKAPFAGSTASLPSKRRSWRKSRRSSGGELPIQADDGDVGDDTPEWVRGSSIRRKKIPSW